MTSPTPSPPDWRPVAADPPPEGVAVETCVRRTGGDTLHLPLRRINGRWYSVNYYPFCIGREPTHWRELT